MGALLPTANKVGVHGLIVLAALSLGRSWMQTMKSTWLLLRLTTNMGSSVLYLLKGSALYSVPAAGGNFSTSRRITSYMSSSCVKWRFLATTDWTGNMGWCRVVNVVTSKGPVPFFQVTRSKVYIIPMKKPRPDQCTGIFITNQSRFIGCALKCHAILLQRITVIKYCKALG